MSFCYCTMCNSSCRISNKTRSSRWQWVEGGRSWRNGSAPIRSANSSIARNVVLLLYLLAGSATKRDRREGSGLKQGRRWRKERFCTPLSKSLNRDICKCCFCFACMCLTIFAGSTTKRDRRGGGSGLKEGRRWRKKRFRTLLAKSLNSDISYFPPFLYMNGS